jgi:glycosyltransferase involved in cell wall biosynthesis
VDIAIEAARQLKSAGVDFQWLVVGDGPERASLQAQIDSLGLGDCFALLGSRENPYGYMKACDILVQSSRVEGRSIVLDEAKILEKPIVATNYTTVVDSLIHGKTGWIVEMTPQAVADGILRLQQDENLRNQLRENLKKEPKGDGALLQRYMEIMF